MKSHQALLALACLLIARPAGASAPGGCLPSEAGATVSRVVASGRIQQAVPPGWKLESADIEVWRLVLTFRDDAGHARAVRLVTRAASEPDGAGRWFAFEIVSGEQKQDPVTRGHLLRAARVVDAAFEDSPWIDCPEALGTRGPVPDSSSAYVRPPPPPPASPRPAPASLPGEDPNDDAPRPPPAPNGDSGGHAEESVISPTTSLPDGGAGPSGGDGPGHAAGGGVISPGGSVEPADRRPGNAAAATDGPHGTPVAGPAQPHPSPARSEPLVSQFHQDRYWFVPPWLYLLLGLVELAAIAAGLWAVFRFATGRGDAR